jgi:hypothetical protein
MSRRKDRKSFVAREKKSASTRTRGRAAHADGAAKNVAKNAATNAAKLAERGDLALLYDVDHLHDRGFVASSMWHNAATPA